MPFVKRKIEPNSVRRHIKDEGAVFEEHSDVAHNALVKILLQLSSLTYSAEDIFREIEEQMKDVFTRCCRVHERIHRLDEAALRLDPKEVAIPMSDMDTEFKIPLHVHYKSSDSLDEDFFISDSRTPCLIHLHQLARNDLNGVLRGSKAYSKPSRPKSFDPNIILQDDKTSLDGLVAPSKSMANIIASSDLTDLYNPQSLHLPTPKQRMEIESSQHKAEVVTVDTSGAQFERRVSLRRSQRHSVSALRRRSQIKLRERHKTMTALPGELSLNGFHRPNSLHSDINSNLSYVGDGSVVSRNSTFSPRDKHNAEIQTEDASPAKRRPKHHRYSMPAFKNGPEYPKRGARISLQHASDKSRPREQNTENKTPDKPPLANCRVSAGDVVEQTLKEKSSFMREKNNTGEDRISSGFWSGTESTRHSTTSEILLQHQIELQALQLSTNKRAQLSCANRNENHGNDNDASNSTLSLNSRLSTLEHSPLTSSSESLTRSNFTPPSTLPTCSPDNSVCMSTADQTTPRQLDFNTPAGAYNFMNPGHFTAPHTHVEHLHSPLCPLILGNYRGNDGMIKDSFGSLDSSLHSQDQEGYYTSMHTDSGITKRECICNGNHSVFTPNTTPNAVVLNVTRRDCSTLSEQPNAASNGQMQPVKSLADDLQCELKARLEKQANHVKTKSSKKPSPPRRTSSLKRPKEAKETLVYMEPLSDDEKRKRHSPIQLSSEPDKDSHAKKLSNSDLARTHSVGKLLVASADHGLRSPVMDTKFTSLSPTSPELVERSPKPKCENNLEPELRSTAAATCQSSIQTKQPSTPNHSKGCLPPFKPVNGILLTNRPPSPAHPCAKPSLSLPKQSLNSPTVCAVNQKTDSLEEMHFESPTCVASNPSSLKDNSDPLTSPVSKSRDKSLSELRCISPVVTKTVTTAFNYATREMPQESRRDFSRKLDNRPTTPQKLVLEHESKLSLPSSPCSNEESSSNTSTPLSSNSVELSVAFAKLSHVSAGRAEETEHKQNITTHVKPPAIDTLKETHIPPVKKAAPEKPPKPILPKFKPPIRPKPVLFPRPVSHQKEKQTATTNEHRQVSARKQFIKERNANARAAFFGLTQTTAVKAVQPTAAVIEATAVQKMYEQHPKGEEKNDFKEADSAEKELTKKNKCQKTLPLSVSTVLETVAQKGSPPKSQSGAGERVELRAVSSIDALEISEEATSEDPTDQKEIAPKQEETPRKVAISEEFVKEPPHHERKLEVGSDVVDGCVEKNVSVTTKNEKKNIAADLIDVSSPSSFKQSDFTISMHRLRNSLRSPESNGIRSPRSPSSPFDRRFFGRSSMSSLERKSRTSPGPTSRENFKALLLQSFSKSASGSQMSAAEKLQMSRESSRKSPTSSNDADDVFDGKPGTNAISESPKSKIVSVGDLRAAMHTSRPGRRTNRPPELRLSYPSKKHPPISLSGRYNSRSRTPTRPMMAINEDVENEISEKTDDVKPRSASVSHF